MTRRSALTLAGVGGLAAFGMTAANATDVPTAGGYAADGHSAVASDGYLVEGAAVAAYQRFNRWPVAGYDLEDLTQYFNIPPGHWAIDIAMPLNTPIVAVASGKVLYAGRSLDVTPPVANKWATLPYNDMAGNQVVVEHSNGLITNYCHLNRWNVSTGQSVSEGQLLGGAGDTGVAFGVHLHFEVIEKSTMFNGETYGRKNPLNHLPAENTPPTGRPTIRSTGDLLAVDSTGVLWNYPSVGNGNGFGERYRIGAGWSSLVTGWVVDWNGDGVLDIVTHWNNGDVRVYEGKPGGGFQTRRTLGVGFNTTQIAPARLRTSDTRPGIITKYSNGDLYYFPNTNGGITGNTRFQIGHGWANLDINALDFNSDGKMDILARNADRDLIAYWGNGSGGFNGTQQVGNDWNFKGLAPTRGFAGSGTQGLFAQRAGGDLFYYPINGGRFGTPSQVGHGFGSFQIFNTQRL